MDEQIVNVIMQRRARLHTPENRWQEWLKKNEWRARGMLNCLGLMLPMELTRVVEPVPSHKMLLDLPSYCYDMHTRVGVSGPAPPGTRSEGGTGDQ